LLQFICAFEAIQQSLRNTGKAHLSACQSPGQHGPGLVLATAIDGMKYRTFKIIAELRASVVSAAPPISCQGRFSATRLFQAWRMDSLV
jgi:hypothetical protein